MDNKTVHQEARTRRRRGGQKGNQNARKHGFYSKMLTPAQQETLPAAAALDGLDRGLFRGTELAPYLIRGVPACESLHDDPRNVNVLTLALSSLARLLRARQLPARWYRAKWRLGRKDTNLLKKGIRRSLGDSLLRPSRTQTCPACPEPGRGEPSRRTKARAKTVHFHKTNRVYFEDIMCVMPALLRTEIEKNEF